MQCLKFLAENLEITRANIRNIALTAAFLAADDGGVIKMVHLMRAVGREYQKMGKILREKDRYLSQLKHLCSRHEYKQLLQNSGWTKTEVQKYLKVAQAVIFLIFKIETVATIMAD